MDIMSSFDDNLASDVNIDFYPLSPLQEGMLFHTLYAPGSGVYVNQLSQVISGGLDVSAFKLAWKQVISRHAILRTSFIWEGLREPVQVVEQEISLPLEEHDWRGIEPAQQEERLEAFLLADRARGFEPSQAPLIRLALIQLTDTSYHFIWTWHHLLVDGWSVSVLLQEAYEYYTAYSQGGQLELEQPRPYRDYIAWIKRQNVSEAEEFWRRMLEGFKAPKVLIANESDSRSERKGSIGGQEIRVSAETTAALQALARQHHLTLNTIVKGAWALLLSGISGEREVLFGGVISGRPADLTGVESMVGLFVNALPVRVRVTPQESLISWLKQLQVEQVDAMRYGYISLAEIQRLAGVQPGSPWFESVLAFDNYPGSKSTSSASEERSLNVGKIRQMVQTNYPMSVSITPGRELYFGIGYDTSWFDDATITRLLEQSKDLLERIAANPGQTLAALLPATVATPEIKKAQTIQATDVYKKSNLTKHQLLTWVGQKLNPQVSQYISAGLIIIPTRIERDHFQNAFQKLVDQSDALRTIVEEFDGIPQQRALEHMPCEIEHLDFSDSDNPHDQLRAWARARCQTPFDLTKRLFDAALVKLADHEYAFYLNLNHLITDAYSDSVIAKLLSKYYELSLKGELNEAAELPRFQDYVEHEREHFDSARATRAQRYWDEKLSEKTEPLTLYGNSTVNLGTQVERMVWEAGENRTKRLKEIASLAEIAQGAATANIFASLLCAYLYHVSGSRKLWLGVPFHNRTIEAHKQTIGLFMQIFPVGVTAEEGDTFLTLIKKFATEQLKSLRYRDYLVGNNAYNRAYDVYFNYITVTYVEEFRSAKVTREWVLPGHGNNGLAMQVHEDWKGNYVVEFDFHRDVFEPWLIEEAISHFESVVDSFLEDYQRPIADVRLLSGNQRMRVLEEFNATDRSYSSERTITELFEKQVSISNKKVAVEEDDKRLTYEELNARANQLARRLKALGVGPETLVCLCVERSLDMIVGILGILKSGAAYVPLDPSYPQERLAFMLDDSRAPVLLTHEHLLENLPVHNAVTICLDRDWASIAEESTENLISGATPDNLAYVIYTSGSTGMPKGTMIQHRSMVSYTQTVAEAYGVEPADRVLQFCSISFDISVEEIFPCLTHSATLVLRTDAMVRSIPAFLNKCQEWAVTMLSLPTAYWHEITAGLKAESLSIPPSLRVVIIAGERAIPDWLTTWQGYAGQRPRLINTYGLTESTVVSTVCELTSLSLATIGSREVPVGHPIGNTQMYILDKDMQPLPVGMPGELYIGGLLLGRGYFNRQSATAEKFVPNPYGQESGSRLYKTGDMGRYLPDGNIEFLGRIDHQVKIRGFRIELEEIEATLRQHPSVQQSVVVAQEHRSGNKRLVAYVVPEQQRAPAAKELRGFLQQKLPAYMVPSTYVVLESLPLTPNGKVDRQALPAPDFSRPEMEKEFVAPDTPIEKILAEIWVEVLGVKEVGIYDNFFDLGGDSIRSIQVLARAREMGLDFSIPDLFQQLTIHELSLHVQVLTPDSLQAVTTYPFSLVSEQDKARLPDDAEDAYPLARVQAGMLYHTAFNSDASVYQSISSLHVEVPFDLEKIRQAIQEVAARHPLLRASFDLENYSEPLQIIHTTISVPLAVDDLRHQTAEEQGREIAAWIEAEKNKRFDWTSAPLMRFQIHRRSDDSFQFTRSEHHAIMDGWSHSAMVAELFHIYLNLLGENSEPIAPPPATTYRDFVATERALLESAEARSFWAERLDGRTFTQIPRWTSQQRKTPLLREQRVEIPSEVSAGLKRLASLAEAPVKSVLLASTLRVLSMVSGQTDVMTGLVTNSRPEDVDAARVIGVYLNSLPFRMKMTGGTWIELVRDTFKVEQDYLPFQQFPTAELQRITGGQPLFETLFNYVHFHVFEGVKSPSAKLLEMKNYAPTNYTLVIDFEQDLTSSQINLVLMYDSAQLCHEQMKAMADYFANTLAAMARQPFESYHLCSPLSQRERDQLIYEWNDAGRDFATDNCLHRLFEAQAERTPHATALSLGGTRMTYGELDRRTNQMARYLQMIGVGPETLVGLYMERSLEMMVGLIGILKAGGGYVPLEPVYPSERLEFMLSDAGATVLLTQDELAEKLPSYNGQVISVDARWKSIGKLSAESLRNEVAPDNPAYVIYTSGSTGKPKGVVITHANVARLFEATRELYDFDERDVWTMFHSYAFDFSVWEIWGALLTGGQLIITPYLMSRDPKAFYEMMAEEGVTVLNQTPSAFLQLIRAEEQAGVKELSLKYVIFGGEALDPQSLKPWFERHGDRNPQMVNMYGITETTVHVTHRRLETKDATVEQASMIGRAIPDLQAYILDEYLELAPVGVPGEIHVAGAGLARGYLNQPELTAGRFIPDLYNQRGGSRLYRSGDKGRYTAQGEIEYLGRIDHQTKIRGYRIELGEIESVLASHPSVRETVVLVREDSQGDKQIVAYVVGGPDFTPAIDELRSYLKSKLPDYMIPSAFMVMDEFPLTPHGKVDRKKLPAFDQTRQGVKSEYVAPRNTLELELANIWEELFGISPIGVNDNFFDLGGHSLMAVRMMAQIKKRFGQEFPLDVLFQEGTISDLARALGENSENSTWSPLVAIQPRGTKPPFFCVHPLGGHVVEYNDLARHLGTDQPFYGLQAPRLADSKMGDGHLSIEEMATRYVAALRELQPRGPYMIGGYSYGGIVAFEMAQQLRDEGEETNLLALIDAISPNNFRKLPVEHEDNDAILLFIIARMRAFEMGKRDLDLTPEDFIRLPEEQRIESFLDYLKKADLLDSDIPSEVGIPYVRNFMQGFRVRRNALRQYEPKVYQGRITFFACTEKDPNHIEALEKAGIDINDATAGWRELTTKPVEVEFVDAYHERMCREPYVGALAERLRACLHKARLSFSAP